MSNNQTLRHNPYKPHSIQVSADRRCGLQRSARGPALAAALLVACVAVDLCAAENAADKPFPAYADVEKVVAEHLAGLTNYQSGDLITQQDVRPLFSKLNGIGWTVAEQTDIEKRLLSDRDFLVQQLRSRSGRPFMRKIARMRNGYDRLDRLRNMPHGKRRIKELVRGPDGHKLIQYMTTTPGGTSLGKSLGKARNGRTFNQPTGRLYSDDEFVSQLAQAYEAEKQRRESQGPADTN